MLVVVFNIKYLLFCCKNPSVNPRIIYTIIYVYIKLNREQKKVKKTTYFSYNKLEKLFDIHISKKINYIHV